MYVLIVIVAARTMATAEFSTQNACERAGSSFKLAYAMEAYGRVIYSCTPKGDK